MVEAAFDDDVVAKGQHHDEAEQGCRDPRQLWQDAGGGGEDQAEAAGELLQANEAGQ